MFSRGDGILNKDLNDIDYQYHDNIKSQGGFTLYKIISLGKTSMIAVMLTLVLLLSACGQAANQGNAPASTSAEVAKSTNNDSVVASSELLLLMQNTGHTKAIKARCRSRAIHKEL